MAGGGSKPGKGKPQSASAGVGAGVGAGATSVRKPKGCVLDLHSNRRRRDAADSDEDPVEGLRRGRFEDPTWWSHMPCLKPIGLNAMLTYQPFRAPNQQLQSDLFRYPVRPAAAAGAAATGHWTAAGAELEPWRQRRSALKTMLLLAGGRVRSGTSDGSRGLREINFGVGGDAGAGGLSGKARRRKDRRSGTIDGGGAGVDVGVGASDLLVPRSVSFKRPSSHRIRTELSGVSTGAAARRCTWCGCFAWVAAQQTAHTDQYRECTNCACASDEGVGDPSGSRGGDRFCA